MNSKKMFFAAVAAAALAACTGDQFADAPPVVTPEVEPVQAPIEFSSVGRGMTRADYTGADAAAKLGGKFVVFGYKGAATATPGTTVFDNYVVEYTANTANTTASNTSNWGYVGKGRIKHATDRGVTQQATKYWDYSQAQYDFIAWSAGSKTAVYTGEPADGEVLVSAISATAAESPATGLAAAYTLKGKAKDLTDCYISDLLTVKKADYQQTVTMKFRSLGTKVRIGIYETIPGYSVKDVKFYSAANVALADETDATDGTANAAKNATPKLFTVTADDIFTEGTYTVYFPTVDAEGNSDNNQAHISFAGTGTQSTVVDFGALKYTIAEDGERTSGAVFLGRSANTASMAGEAEGNYYTQYLPNEGGTNLNLRVDYTLESIDGSGETILVKGATAQVPSIYTQWKAGYAYTYLFKISDKTNGHTGTYDPTEPDNTTVNSDPAGLYPITFDAVVVNSEEDATQETITLVTAPSITTYQKGSNVVNDNEYLAATGDIFVTVNDGTTATTPDLANGALQALTGKAALYTLPAGKTEAEVVDALAIQDDDAAAGTIRGRNGIVLTSKTLSLTNKIEYGADGNTINVGTDEAARFTPAAGTYAFVYTKTPPTTTEDKYEPQAFASFATGATKYRYGYQNAVAGDVQEGVSYYAEASGVYTLQSPFLGQTVANLYTDAAGTTIATGYAQTGQTYYYTTDRGMTYTAAHNVAYADFATAELYTEASGVYTAKTETTPAANTAYYYKETDGSYTYCVIQPQQTTDLKVLDTTTHVVASETTAVGGQTYFDKYTKNNGVYYVKVIKVQ
ncbi:MAG: hypothetical protein IJ637_08305 [Prevotella sp.]|nr:hypothetical protein [Prevotella sp.]